MRVYMSTCILNQSTLIGHSSSDERRQDLSYYTNNSELFPKENTWVIGSMSPKLLKRQKVVLVDSNNQLLNYTITLMG